MEDFPLSGNLTHSYSHMTGQLTHQPLDIRFVPQLRNGRAAPGLFSCIPLIEDMGRDCQRLQSVPMSGMRQEQEIKTLLCIPLHPASFNTTAWRHTTLFVFTPLLVTISSNKVKTLLLLVVNTIVARSTVKYQNCCFILSRGRPVILRSVTFFFKHATQHGTYQLSTIYCLSMLG